MGWDGALVVAEAMHFNRYYCGKCHLTYLIKKDLPPPLEASKPAPPQEHTVRMLMTYRWALSRNEASELAGRR